MADSLNIFNTNIDEAAQDNLLKAAKWAKVLSALGVAASVGILIIAIYLFVLFNPRTTMSASYVSGMSWGGAMYYFFVALGIFYPSLLLNKFAVNITSGINQNNQQPINQAFKNLKNLFRFTVILAVIFVLIIALLILVNVVNRP